MIGQVSRNIDFYIQAMEGMISLVTDDPDVRAFFEFGGTAQPFDQQSAERTQRLLRSATDSRPEIAGMLLVKPESWPPEIQSSRGPCGGAMVRRGAPGKVCFCRDHRQKLRGLYGADDIVSLVRAVDPMEPGQSDRYATIEETSATHPGGGRLLRGRAGRRSTLRQRM
jgi:hypothetical protein